MHASEILLSTDKVTSKDWENFVVAVSAHVKGLKPVTIAVIFHENVIRFFAISRHDLTVLSTGIEGVMLRSVSDEDMKLVEKPNSTSKIRLLRIPAGGNVLDLKERYKVTKGLDLTALYIDVQRLGGKVFSKMHSYFKVGGVYKSSHQQLALFPAHLLAIDFTTHSSYLKHTAPKYLNIEKATGVLQSDNINALFSIDTYPYLPHDYYLNISNYEFDKHSFIVGASGSGKSKFIELFIDRIQKTSLGMNYRVVVIDPHASLEKDLQYIPSTKVVNFSGESAQLFPEAGADISAATELTTTLFKSLMGDQFNPRLERTLRYSLYVLFVSQSMSMDMLKKFLTDIEVRTKVMEHVHGFVPTNVEQFFGSDFNEMRTQFYNEAISPIVSLVEEMQLQPSMVGEAEQSLARTIQENFLTVFSLNKVSMGEKVVKTVAGLLIQQIFLLAQARAFGQKIILIIDEVSIVQNPALASILAEARKFNLSVILTQQYFGQIDDELKAAILSNVINYYVFKVSEEDARTLEGNLGMELPAELVAKEMAGGLKEPDIRVKMMNELHPRECLVRVSANGQLLPCIKGRTVDTEPHGNLLAGGVDGNTANLKPFKAAALPAKFSMSVSNNDSHLAELTEVNYGPRPTLKSAENSDLTPSVPSVGGQPVGSVVTKNIVERDESAPGMSLSELLATQSSSRKKLKKEK